MVVMRVCVHVCVAKVINVSECTGVFYCMVAINLWIYHNYGDRYVLSLTH